MNPSPGHFHFCRLRLVKRKQGRKMRGERMKQLKVINVFLVASVSAALHGIMAVIFVPAMSVMFLAQNTAQAQLGNSAITDNIMVWAVVAPILWAAVGFI